MTDSYDVEYYCELLKKERADTLDNIVTSYDIFLEYKKLEDEKYSLEECLESYQYDESGNYAVYGHNYQDENYTMELFQRLAIVEERLSKVEKKMEKYIKFKKEIEINYIKFAMHPSRVNNYLVTHNINLIDLDFDALVNL
jgi:hypothetical protein